MSSPILYSFRRCPYAIRARLALVIGRCNCEVREVKLARKPSALLAVSDKATVPVLCLPNGTVIDESLDIMRWATRQCESQTEDCLNAQELEHPLVLANDTEFKYWLDRYKYFDRFPEQSQHDYWNKLHPLLETLDQHLLVASTGSIGLLNASPSLIDWAILPFVRQCSLVDQSRFAAQAPARLQQWLKTNLSAEYFVQVMHKAAFWYAEGDPTYNLLET